MSLAEAFPEITRRHEPLAPYTHLKTGGPADFFVEPRSVEELKGVIRYCHEHQLPLRMLGGGFNLLVRDEPIRGVVMRLQHPAFRWIEGTGPKIRSAGGTLLYDLLAHATRCGMSGLESLVGIRGTVGGSVRCNVGDRNGEIASAVRQVAVLTEEGTEEIRRRDELTFGDHRSDLDEPVILWIDFILESDAPESVLRRMRKAWVLRKTHEPLSFQPAVRMFRDPPGQSAAALIEKARLAKTRIGSAEISERNGNYAIAHPGTTAKDILKLIELVRKRIQDLHGISLEQELHVW
jgi:UDP-N-acetylmuramate dehydrogenase